MDVALEQIDQTGAAALRAERSEIFRVRLARFFEQAAFYIVLAAVPAAAFFFGGVDPWIQGALAALFALAGAFRVGASVAAGSSFFEQPAALMLVPAAGIALLAVVQSAAWFDYFPAAAARDSILFAGSRTISAAPFETVWFALIFSSYLIALDVLFFTVNRQRLRILTGTVIAVGTASAAFGLFRVGMSGNEPSFISEMLAPGTGFAQFFNRNHFVFLMEMTIGLLLGLALKGDTGKELRYFTGLLIVFLTVVTISVNSRGGLLSVAFVISSGFFLHFLTKRKSGARRTRTDWLKRASIGTAAAAGFIGLLVIYIALVGGDPVVKRVEVLQQEIDMTSEENAEQIDRKKIWAASLELIGEYPIAGAGFGAYPAAITRFDRSGGRFSLEQAHNDYLEIAAGGGILAVVLTLVFGGLAAAFFRRQFRSADRFRRAACFGAALAVIGVMLHSSVEFGLHTPVNFLLFLMLIVIGTARVEEDVTDYEREISLRRESTEAGGW